MLPGWNLSAGERPQWIPEWLVGLSVGLDLRSPGAGYVTLVDRQLSLLRPPPESPNRPSLALPFDGKFSLALVPLDSPPVHVAYILRQTGDIPADAQRIEFLNYGEPFEVRLNGVPVSLTYDYRVIDIMEGTQQLRVARVVGDISAWAGSAVELEFKTLNERSPGPEPDPGFGFNYRVNGLDSIVFVVPEPGTWALLGFGGVGLLAANHFRRRLDRTATGP
jgi:hypothetical protein